MRASASLPYFSRPVEIHGAKYLDGGCADSVPVHAFLCMDEILEMEKLGEVFIIQPSVPLEVGRTETDPGKIQAAYDQGVADAKTLLGELKDWLKQPFTKKP